MNRAIGLLAVSLCLSVAVGCGNGVDHHNIDRVSSKKEGKKKRLSQPKFEPEDFTFVKYLDVDQDHKGGQWATCLHVPLRDENDITWDCDLGIGLPLHLAREEYPRIKEEASRTLARAANAAKHGLKDFKHADTRTCKAFGDRMIALIRQGWPGVRIARCDTYLRKSLPDFYFSKGPLLIGDYLEWRKKKRDR